MPTISTQDIIRLVVEGLERTWQDQQPREKRIHMSHLKLTNPETFDGKPWTSFSTWWKTVTKYLSFYPEIMDQQRIAWVGTLLTCTTKAWDLHRYDTFGEGDTWVNWIHMSRLKMTNPETFDGKPLTSFSTWWGCNCHCQHV